jgi:hypothetical protein
MPVSTEKVEPGLLRLMACHPTLVHTILHPARSNALPRCATSYREPSLFCRARQGLRRIRGRV